MKYELLRQTTSYWVGQYKQGRYDMEGSWQEAQSNPRTRPRWTYSRGASRSSHSSMYEVYIVVIRVRRKDWNVTSLLYNSSVMLDYSYLCSLYNSLFLFDYLSSLEPVIHSHAWLLLCRISGAVHSVILIDVYLDLESPRGLGFWVGEGRRVTEGNKEGVSLRASGSRGGRVLTQEEGSK